MDQQLTTLLQQRWLSKLLGFDYVIKYKHGSKNCIVDALSRVIEELGDCYTLMVIQPQWMQDVIAS